MNMKFLSDDIFVPFDLDQSYEGKYIEYTVIAGVPGGGSSPMYEGRMYYTKKNGNRPGIYLNSLLESWADNLLAYRDLRDGIVTNTRMFAYPSKSILWWGVDVKDPIIGYGPDEVYNGYMDIDLDPKFKIENLNQGNADPAIYNPQEMREGIYPRIPYLPGAKNFWIAPSFIINKAYNDKLGVLGTAGKMYMFSDYPKNFDKPHTFYISSFASQNITFPYIGAPLDSFSEKSTELFIGGSYNSILLPKIKIADIDQCPAEYYVVWVDRLGCYQCQPFCKRNVMSETTKVQMVSNNLNIMRPYHKEVEYKWTLNTDWIGEKEHRTFESLLTSPYIYLYETKRDKGVWCICEKNSWENKTSKNNKKLYNFNVTLKADRKQNIIY